MYLNKSFISFMFPCGSSRFQCRFFKWELYNEGIWIVFNVITSNHFKFQQRSKILARTRTIWAIFKWQCNPARLLVEVTICMVMIGWHSCRVDNRMWLVRHQVVLGYKDAWCWACQEAWDLLNYPSCSSSSFKMINNLLLVIIYRLTTGFELNYVDFDTK